MKSDETAKHSPWHGPFHVRPLQLLFLLLLPAAALLLSGCVHSKTRLELAETYYNLGNAYTELEEWNRAGEAYLRAMELDPSLRKAGYQMARVYVQAGEYVKAEKQLVSLLSEDPGNQIIRENLAWVYVQSGKTEDARELYMEILEENPADCDVRYNLALLQLEEEKWEHARDILSPCLEYGRADAEIYRVLGKAVLRLEDEAAVGYLEKAFEEDPGLPGLARELASAYRQAELYGQAVDIYDRLIERAEAPEDAAGFRFEKAYLLFTAIEDYARGEESLREALEAGYRDEEKFRELFSDPGLLDPERVRDVFEESGVEVPPPAPPDEEEEEAAS